MKRILIIMLLAVTCAVPPATAGSPEPVSRAQYDCRDSSGHAYRCEVARYGDDRSGLPGGAHALVTITLNDGRRMVNHAYPCGAGCGWVMVGEDFTNHGGSREDFKNDRALCLCP